MPDRMPTLFVGHGSPESAMVDNVYSRHLAPLGRELPRPRAVLVVSAHYLTSAIAVVADD